MKKVRTLLVTFKNDLSKISITAFRGAIIEKVGREHVMFHNHLGDGYIYSYPLIQYKIVNGQNAILCLGPGVDELYKLFHQPNWTIGLKGEQVTLEVDEMELKNQVVAVSADKRYTYSLKRWQALSEKNNHHLHRLRSIMEKVVFLEKILIGNILSFAKGMEWTVDEQIRLTILEIPDIKKSRVKDIQIDAFDVIFETNVELPNWISLGKGASQGFGVIKKIKNKVYA